MGIIYKIYHVDSNKTYIGQTRTTLKHRGGQHQYSARALAKGKTPSDGSGTCTKLYRAMAKYGIGKFRMVKIIEVPDEDLNDFEEIFVGLYDSVRSGYNLMTGGGASRHSDETRIKMSETIQKNRPGMIDKFRKHEESKGLPMYVSYLPDDGNGYKGYALIRHPLCNKKHFTLKHFPTLESAKYACLAFLENLIKEGKTYQGSRTNPALPKGISRIKGGYRVRIQIDPDFPRLDKAFCDSKTSDEDKLNEAKAYIAEAKFRYLRKKNPEQFKPLDVDPLD